MTELHRDWLPLMDLILSSSSHSLRFADWKTLRTTNKAIKQLVDPILFKRLKLDFHYMHRLEDIESKAIAASPILEHVKELRVHVHAVGEEDEYKKLFLGCHKKALVSILSQIAPRLEQLHILDDLFLVPSLLPKSVKLFKQLKTLDILSASMNFDIIQTLKPALFSVTKLETLKLMSDAAKPINGVDIEGLKILAQAPLENLTSLHFLLQYDDDIDITDYANPGIIEPLTTLLRRCSTNLKDLDLRNAHSLQNYHELLPNLERLDLSWSVLPEDGMLPRSLEYLALQLELGSPTTVLSSGNFPQLKILNLSIEEFYEHDNWSQCMHRVSLPSLETLNLNSCEGLTSNDVFCIAYAARNIPKLRNYSVHSVQDNPPDLQLVSQFFSSTICRNLETLRLGNVEFNADGFKEFVDNASNMPHLKTLSIKATTKLDIQSMADAGARGAWPHLQYLEIFCNNRRPLLDGVRVSARNGPVAFDRYRRENKIHCNALLNRIWPSLKVEIYSLHS